MSILDPVALRAAALPKLSSLARGQVVLGRHSAGFAVNASSGTDAATSSSDGTAQFHMVRYFFRPQVDAFDVRVVLGNHAAYNPGLNDLYITAAVEDQANTATVPATFNGNVQAVVAGGGASRYVVSDPIPRLKVSAGLLYAVRLYVSVARLGDKWPLGRVLYGTLGDGQSATTGDVTQATGVVTASSAAAYTPAAVIGSPVNGIVPPTFILVGDSITYGSTDSTSNEYVGFLERAIGPSYGLINFGRGGITVSELQGIDQRASALVFSLAGPCSHMISAGGRNDVSNGQAIAGIQANLIRLWTHAANAGLRSFQTTITPRSDSTDSWATLGNQSPHALSHDEIRVPLNAWIRDGAPMLAGAAVATGSSVAGTIRAGASTHPLRTFIEVADVVESARDSGFWKVDGSANKYTGDGLHPAPFAHQQMAAAINAAALVSA